MGVVWEVYVLEPSESVLETMAVIPRALEDFKR